MNKLPTKLLEYLVRQCTREVLNQISEEKEYSGHASKEKTKVIKAKFAKEKPFKPTIKKINEEDDENNGMAPPANGQGTGDAPAIPTPKETEPEVPSQPETPPESNGPALINPRDKSKLQPVRFQGRDESAVERTLHGLAVSVVGPRAKVSLGAKRLAREAASNPNAKIYFYFGKTDPESEEVFLMADKSLQIAKDESVDPSELQGSPSTRPTEPDDISADYDRHNLNHMDDKQYNAYQAQKIRGTPRYGIDEETHLMIKRAVNKILDRK